jgi:hypothetical protein
MIRKPEHIIPSKKTKYLPLTLRFNVVILFLNIFILGYFQYPFTNNAQSIITCLPPQLKIYNNANAGAVLQNYCLANGFVTFINDSLKGHEKVKSENITHYR